MQREGQEGKCEEGQNLVWCSFTRIALGTLIIWFYRLQLIVLAAMIYMRHNRELINCSSTYSVAQEQCWTST